MIGGIGCPVLDKKFSKIVKGDEALLMMSKILAVRSEDIKFWSPGTFNP